MFWLLWIRLLWTPMYKFWCGQMFSISWMDARRALLGHMITLFPIFRGWLTIFCRYIPISGLWGEPLVFSCACRAWEKLDFPASLETVCGHPMSKSWLMGLDVSRHGMCSFWWKHDLSCFLQAARWKANLVMGGPEAVLGWGMTLGREARRIGGICDWHSGGPCWAWTDHLWASYTWKRNTLPLPLTHYSFFLTSYRQIEP